MPFTKPVSLIRLLQQEGFGSRRQCQALIQSGLVRDDHAALLDADETRLWEGVQLSVDGQTLTVASNVLIALNKPEGFECSRSPQHHPSVLTLLPPRYLNRGVQPVGRLDQDTTGLLLLTDDGGLLHALTSPKRHTPKRYRARLSSADAERVAFSLGQGIVLRGETEVSAALDVRVCDDETVELSITEGRYHQVRRMIAAAGSRCLALERVAIGGLTLHELKLASGAWCVLTEKQRERCTIPVTPPS